MRDSGSPSPALSPSPGCRNIALTLKSPTAPNAAAPVFAELSGLCLAPESIEWGSRAGGSMLVGHLPFLWLLLLSQPLPAGSGVEIAPRGFSGLTIFLLLADLRSGIGDAAFYEISLNLELLLRA
jgi:hypothetical protein